MFRKTISFIPICAVISTAFIAQSLARMTEVVGSANVADLYNLEALQLSQAQKYPTLDSVLQAEKSAAAPIKSSAAAKPASNTGCDSQSDAYAEGYARVRSFFSYINPISSHMPGKGENARADQPERYACVNFVQSSKSKSELKPADILADASIGTVGSAHNCCLQGAEKAKKEIIALMQSPAQPGEPEAVADCRRAFNEGLSIQLRSKVGCAPLEFQVALACQNIGFAQPLTQFARQTAQGLTNNALSFLSSSSILQNNPTVENSGDSTSPKPGTDPALLAFVPQAKP